LPQGSFIRLDAGPYATYEWDDNSRSQFRIVQATELSTNPRAYWVKVNDGLSTCFGSDTLLLSLRQPQSLPEAAALNSWTTYPNPFGDVLQVQSQNPVQFQLFYPDGRAATALSKKRAGLQQISTAGLAPGMYILECRDGQSRTQRQVLRLP
jgi:hypothetical protein